MKALDPSTLCPGIRDAVMFPTLGELTMKLKSCPFCGGEDLGESSKKNPFVDCMECSATGPTGQNPEHGDTLWNIRWQHGLEAQMGEIKEAFGKLKEAVVALWRGK